MLSDYKIVITLPVQWGDIDAFGHMNNVRFFRFFESARIAYLEQMGILDHDGVGAILAMASTKFKSPVFYPDTVKVGVKANELQQYGFMHNYAMFSEQQNKIVATGEGRIVSYDYEQKSKVEIPSKWIDKIRQIEGIG